jgi:hypothetical protein
MKELLVEKTSTQDSENLESQKLRRNRRTKVITRVNAKAPACSACEIPILSVLSEAPEEGMRAKVVIRQVKTKWFNRLNPVDCVARYPFSRKKITDTVVKFSKKNLALKHEVFPVSEEIPLGNWKITQKGLVRVRNEIGGWTARYGYHDAIIIEGEGELTEIADPYLQCK